jgi:PAS domain S-box-containing protein
MKEEPLPNELLSLKASTSWSWERMAREFHRVMGAEGPSHTTLLRYAIGKVKRRNVVTERYVQDAVRKITVELSQTGQALQIPGAQLEYVINSSPAVTYRCKVNGEVFTPVFTSKNLQERFGYEEQEVLGNSDWWTTHIHPQDRKRIFDQLSKSLHSQDEHSHEYRFQHRDGTYRWVQDTLNLARDDEGHVIEIVGSWLDITNRRRAKK